MEMVIKILFIATLAVFGVGIVAGVAVAVHLFFRWLDAIGGKETCDFVICGPPG